MIKFIKEKINRKFYSIEKSQLESKLLQLDELALIQLYKMFNDNLYLPITRWSLPPRELLHICNDIVLKNRKSVIEFGSGYSTIILCKLIELNKLNCRFISIDNNQDWLNKLEEKLVALNLIEHVKLICAPITKVDDSNILMKDQDKWYDLDVLNSALKEYKEFDLIIVDGPYGGITNFARFTAIPFLKSKIEDDFGVFLDNSDREQEKLIITEWKNILQGHLMNFEDYSYLTNNSDFVAAPYGVKHFK